MLHMLGNDVLQRLGTDVLHMLSNDVLHRLGGDTFTHFFAYVLHSTDMFTCFVLMCYSC